MQFKLQYVVQFRNPTVQLKHDDSQRPTHRLVLYKTDKQPVDLTEGWTLWRDVSTAETVIGEPPIGKVITHNCTPQLSEVHRAAVQCETCGKLVCITCLKVAPDIVQDTAFVSKLSPEKCTAGQLPHVCGKGELVARHIRTPRVVGK